MSDPEMFREALWFNSEADGERQSAERGIVKIMAAFAEEAQVSMGPVIYYELSADDVRVVDPPVEWQAGTPVCLVGVSEVTALPNLYLTGFSAFTHELDVQDLDKLRTIHRKQYALAHPADVMENGQLTDAECDAGINEIGPDIALAGLERYKEVLN